MGLDFTILNDKEEPIKYFDIGLQDHVDLMEIAETLDTPLVLRMKEYHEHVIYQADEIDQLKNELSKILNTKKPNKSLIVVIEGLIKICDEAISLKTDIHVLVD